MEFLKWIGGFVQQTVTTNTAVEVASSIADIHYNHKRARGIACLVTSLIGVGGGAALFVLEPSILSYFNTIILKALPFLGTVAPTVFTGIIGAWFGGGFGHNVAKECAREYSERNLGHSNSAYTFTNQDVLRIVEENPQIYNYSDLTPEEAAQRKARDVQDLIDALLLIRDQIDQHRGDGTTAKAENKYPLLEALGHSNMMPLIELVAKSDTKREVRKQAALKIGNYVADADVGRLFGEPPQVPRQPRAPRGRNARRRAPPPQQQQPIPVDIEVGIPVDAVPVVPPVPAEVPVQLEPVARARVARAVGPQEVLINPDAVVYANLFNYIRALNQGEVKDPRRRKRQIEVNDRVHVLTPYEKNLLLESLKHTYQEQNEKQINGRRNTNPILEKALRSTRMA